MSPGCGCFVGVGVVVGVAVLVAVGGAVGVAVFVGVVGGVGVAVCVVVAGGVLRYAAGELIVGCDAGDCAPTWTPLPVTVGVDEDGDEYIDYSITYSYAYNIQDLYIDLLGSSPLDFGSLARTDFHLLLIPGNLYVGNARAGIDYTDYEAVQRAYDLPE